MQLTHTENPPLARVGMIADVRIMRHVRSRIAASYVQAGRGVFRVPGFGEQNDSTNTTRMVDPGQIYQQTTDSNLADVDGLKVTIGSTAGIQTLTTFDGVLGDHDLLPARKATLVLSSHADWDATTAVLRYVNQEGRTVSENIAIPNGGNATVTSTGYVRRMVSLVIPAQSGTGGTATLGVAAIDTSVVISDFVGIAVYDAAHFSAKGASPITGPILSEDLAAEYAPFETVPILSKGGIWVRTEDACVEGAAVCVRILAGTAGQFRSDVDGGNAITVTGAQWGRDSGVAGLNIVELG